MEMESEKRKKQDREQVGGVEEDKEHK